MDDKQASQPRRTRLRRWLTLPRLTITNAVLIAAIVALLMHGFLANPYAHVYRLSQSSRTDHLMTWTTLGTNGGPLASPTRSEPASVLHDDGDAILIDVGDGAAEQLAKAQVPIDNVSTIVISHLHIDHTGGLFALLGMRLQMDVPRHLTVIGPPGTAAMVHSLLAALQPLREINKDTVSGAAAKRLAPVTTTVEEIHDGSTLTIGLEHKVRLSAVANTHYSLKPGTPEWNRVQSLSLRFDMPDRSIVYTGDTGPSAAVTRLARGADVLVTEINDTNEAIAALRALRPDLPFWVTPILKHHFDQQHLSATAVGHLAREAGVKSVVVVHDPLSEVAIRQAADKIAHIYSGPVAFADDLQDW